MLPVLLIFFSVALVTVAKSVRIVRQYEVGLVERLGKYRRTVSPGPRIIIPFLENIIKVDMREQVVDVPPQEVITADNISATTDCVVYFKPVDPQRLQYNVANFELAAVKLAQTNLRNVLGDLELDEALTARDRINANLRKVLDEATDAWGVRVVRVEVQKIDPPSDVTAAMNGQSIAERTRRATILEAEGAKTSAILHAEGSKAARVLEAAGQAEAQILTADADRRAKILRAAGEAEAIKAEYNAINEGGATPEVLAVQYLESLRAIADGNATKLVLPMELTSVLGGLGAAAEMLGRSASGVRNDSYQPASLDGLVGDAKQAAAAAQAEAAEVDPGDTFPPVV